MKYDNLKSNHRPISQYSQYEEFANKIPKINDKKYNENAMRYSRTQGNEDEDSSQFYTNTQNNYENCYSEKAKIPSSRNGLNAQYYTRQIPMKDDSKIDHCIDKINNVKYYL